MPRTIGKQEAIRRMNREHGAAVLSSRNTHFANVNRARDVWWFDIAEQKTLVGDGEFLELLVYDYRDDHLYHLRVPTEYFRQHRRDFSIRQDKATISLWLSIGKRDQFMDLGSGARGGGVRFAQFLHKVSLSPN